MVHGYENTKEASQRVGLSDSQIRRLLEKGVVNGMKISRDWLVDSRSLDHYIAHYSRSAGGGRKKKNQ
jgi:excisionase family DNA binding protein